MREFWITRNGLTNNDRVSTVGEAPIFKDDVVYHVREVSPAYDKAVEAMVKALEYVKAVYPGTCDCIETISGPKECPPCFARSLYRAATEEK